MGRFIRLGARMTTSILRPCIDLETAAAKRAANSAGSYTALSTSNSKSTIATMGRIIQTGTEQTNAAA